MNTQKIELKQREHLVSLVQEAKSREKKELEEKNGATKETIVGQIIESKGFNGFLKKVEPLREQIRKLEAAVKEMDDALRESGFERADGMICLRDYGVPDATRRLIADKLESAQRPIEKSLKKYDLAAAKIWTSVTSEELQKAVEGLF